MQKLKTVDVKLAEFDELEHQLTEEIERMRDFVKSEFDGIHNEMIERFGREIERQFAERIERARDVRNSKIDELQKEMGDRISHARERVRQL